MSTTPTTPTTPNYETPTFYDPINQVIRTMDTGSYLPPAMLPVSKVPGNTLQDLSDGLYVGGNVALPAVIYVNTMTGVDAMGNGTLAIPYKSLDYALAQLTAASLNMQLQTSAVIALQAGQTFSMMNDLNLYGGTLTFTFYGDTNYGSYTNVPVLGTTTDPEFMSNLARPLIEPAVSSVNGYWHLAGINVYGGNVVLKGVTVQLPMAPAQPSISLYSNAADFVRAMNNTTDGYLELLGAVVNMMDITAFWGILGLNPRSSYSLIQYGSQFQVGGTLLNSVLTPAPTMAQLAARQYFIKFYPDFVGNNQQQGLLYNTAATATNASGILKVMWADTQSFIITNNYPNLGSFPIAYDPTYGLTNYIYGLTIDALNRAVNVLSSRLINSAGSATSSLGTTLVVANNADLNNLVNGTATSAGTLLGTDYIPVTRGVGLLQTTLATIGAWIIQAYQGFTQLGTGVFPRTIQSKARDIVNVLDFGADPAGVLDSTLDFTDAGSTTVPGTPIEVNITSGTYLLNSNPNPTGMVVWVLHAGAVLTGMGVLPGTVIKLAPDMLSTTSNVDITMSGSGLRVAEGTNAKQGYAPLTAGTVTVNNTTITMNSRIFLTAQDNNTMGALRVSSRVAGTSFTITSSLTTDSGYVAYEIFEPG
jgi:hypothetical protein